MSQDCVLRFMEEHNIPLTRENYLIFAYLGTPPKELGAEEEANLPEQFRLREDDDDWKEYE